MTHLASLTDHDLQSAFIKATHDGVAVTANAVWEVFVSRHSLNERGYRDPIVTSHVCPPIPCRDFDWAAHRDSDEGGEARTGYGRTEAEAINALVEREAEEAEAAALDDAADMQAEWDAEVERRAEQAEYERDAAADAKRDALRDDPFERWPDECCKDFV